MSQRSFRRAHERRLAAESRREALRRRRTGLAAGMAIAATAGFAPVAHADTYVVTTTDDATNGSCAETCTLRDAIAAANASTGVDDTITFQSNVTGTIDLASVLNIGSSDPLVSDGALTITGPGQDALSLSGAGTGGSPGSQIFNVVGTDPVGISGLTLTHGYASGPGGAIVTGSTQVIDSKYPVPSGPPLALSGVTVSDSHAQAGGGVYSRGPLTLTDSTIKDNTSVYAGGVFSAGNSTITDSTISGNSTTGPGGGFAQRGSKYGRRQSTISGSQLTGNTAQGDGGAISSQSSAITISGSTLSGNSASNGGAIAKGDGALNITASTISGNTASEDGGGISQDQVGKYSGVPTLTLADTTVSGNTATGSGGGVYASASDTSVRTSTLSGNTAAKGGGVYSSYSSQATAMAAPYPATAQPALVVSSTPELLLENTTLQGNTADYGGGVLLGNQPAATVRGSTIDGNQAHVQGGGLAALHGTHPDIQDSILADNAFAAAKDAPQAGPDVFTDEGSDLTAEYSLIKDVSGATFAADGEDATTTANVGKSPQLGPLADNGGPTKTMKPGGTSPAIDTGSLFGMTTDQRGVARPQLAGPDIGAVELRIAPPVATTTDADNVTDTAATLHGTINVKGAGTYHFEYGTSTDYGSSTDTVTAPSDSTDHAESASLTGLAPNTTYHFRVVASNDENTTDGADRTFTTQSTQSTPSQAPAPPALLPPTVTSLTVNPRCVTSATLVNPRPGTAGLSFSFDLSENATVRYEIFRRNPSPKWRKCPAPGGTAPVTFSSVWSSSDDEQAGHKSTTLATTARHRRRVGRIAMRKGHRRLALARLVTGQKLPWGSYVLKITASNAAGSTVHAATIQFWVLGPWAKSSGHRRSTTHRKR